MERFNPTSRDQFEEEQKIEQFLNSPETGAAPGRRPPRRPPARPATEIRQIPVGMAYS